MKWKQGLPTYTPEPLWDYSWFHQLLKILLHNWAPPVNRVSGSAPVNTPFPIDIRRSVVCLSLRRTWFVLNNVRFSRNEMAASLMQKSFQLIQLQDLRLCSVCSSAVTDIQLGIISLDFQLHVWVVFLYWIARDERWLFVSVYNLPIDRLRVNFCKKILSLLFFQISDRSSWP